MAIVNRTPDSFYRPGLTWDESAALERVGAVVAEGADILDVGGVPAKPGPEVTVAEEIRRVVPFIERVRAAYPDLVISADTWRHEPARAMCAAGADLVNDTWSAWDPSLAEVAAEFGAALGLADEVVVLDVYAAREDPEPGVTGRLVADAVPGGAARYVAEFGEVPKVVAALAAPGDLVLTMGAEFDSNMNASYVSMRPPWMGEDDVLFRRRPSRAFPPQGGRESFASSPE